MEITVQQLKELEACPAGIEDFVKFAGGDTLECEWTYGKQLEVIRSPLRKYFGWGVERKIIPMFSMRGADLHDADLRWTDLHGADLRYADLSEANLSGTDLRYADLRGADLRYADLSEANLRWIKLRGADLRGAVGLPAPSPEP